MTCKLNENCCKANTFCPISTQFDPSPANCLSCSDLIESECSCNCVDGTATAHCRECAGGVCSACFKGYFQIGNGCQECSAGCEECVGGQKCEICLPGYQIEDGKCEVFCGQIGECLAGTYCIVVKHECDFCADDFSECVSDTICGKCKNSGQYVDNSGKCHEKCIGLKNNQYCKDGVIAECDAEVNSPCRCEVKSNCALCSKNGTMCKTCLPGFKLEDGDCVTCKDGFLLVGQLCVEIDSKPNHQHLNSEEIVGLVIACLLILGLVGGCLVMVVYCILRNFRYY